MSEDFLAGGREFARRLEVLLASVASLKAMEPPILTDTESEAEKRDATLKRVA